MSNNIIKLLYKLSRVTGKIATTLNDVEILSSGDPKKISKRIQRKTVNKISNKVRRNVNNKIK